MAENSLQGRVLAEKYELTKLLGQGGMGQVWEARNHLGKRYAVKLLLTGGLGQDPQLAQRFFREAKASAAIESEHIVEVYDTGIDPLDSVPFIIMEMLKGEDLEHTIGRVSALEPMAAARVIAQAATGLGHAHAAGIIHRDIKPANIFMTQRGPQDYVVKILDFGIAKQTLEKLASTDGAGLTKTGSMLGTPLYMSPEQARGLKTVDARTDIWSLGMCLYEALTGKVPWGDVDTLGELILSICSRDVPDVREYAPWVPAELAAVAKATLERDLDKRVPSADRLVELLAPFTGGSLQLMPDLLVGVDELTKNSMTAGTLPAAASISGASASSSGANKALTATTGASSAVSSNIIVQGDGSPETTASEKKKGGTPIAVLAIAAVVLLGIGGLIATKMGGSNQNNSNAATQPEKPVAATTQAAKDPTPPPPTATVEAPKPPPPEATATTTAAASASAPATAATLAIKQPAGPIVAKPPPTGAKPPPAATAPPPATDSKGRIIRKDL